MKYCLASTEAILKKLIDFSEGLHRKLLQVSSHVSKVFGATFVLLCIFEGD